jgi:transcriptional regulator with XRE-family HTH domain
MGGPGKKQVSMQLASVVGTNLARLREAKGLSQEEVAFRAGLHRTEISLMELGKRTVRIDTIVRVVGALEIDMLKAFEGTRWVPFLDKPDGELLLDGPGWRSSGGTAVRRGPGPLAR